MLNKITQIENISRFKVFSSNHEKYTYGAANMYYAPNGRGKTTIADSIQSLLKNDPSILIKRFSKVYAGDPAITITHDDPAVTSRLTSSGTWSNPPTDTGCIVFDKNFIQQNIHTITVEHDHKKKLHGLIVGEGAIEAKEKVRVNKEAKDNLQTAKTDIDRNFKLLKTEDLTLEQFAKLPVEDEKELQAKKAIIKKQLEAIGNPEAVKQKAALSPLLKPYEIDQQLKDSCTKTVKGGSKDAVALLKTHSDAHIHGSDTEKKQFLSSGVKALGSADTSHCAMCGQVISGDSKKLLEALFAIFSQQYLDLKRDVSEAIDTLNLLQDETIITQIEQTEELNVTKRTSWEAYIEKLPEVEAVTDLKLLSQAIVEAKAALIVKLQAKNDDPSTEITDELTAYSAAVSNLDEAIKTYNASVETVNRLIAEFKDGIDVSQKQQLTSDLKTVNNGLIRASQDALTICAQYLANKPALEAADTVYRQSLTEFAIAQKAVIDNHGEVINKILEFCGAKFKVSGMEQGTRTGSTDPYIEYSITLVGGTSDSETSASDAVGYILSEGEKNLLAFAFFWSLLTHMDLSKTIAIFDDPLSSIDLSWRNQLIDKLNEASSSGLMQLFIFTHYEDFARMVAMRFSNIKQFTIDTQGAVNGNTINRFDIESISKEMQYARIEMLKAYIENPSRERPEHIQSEIRNCLESALKSKYYLKLKSMIGKKWLRDFIEHEEVKPLLQANGSYQELDSLCSNSGWSHHDNPREFVFNEDQATAYAQRTLDIIEKL